MARFIYFSILKVLQLTYPFAYTNRKAVTLCSCIRVYMFQESFSCCWRIALSFVKLIYFTSTQRMNMAMLQSNMEASKFGCTQACSREIGAFKCSPPFFLENFGSIGGRGWTYIPFVDNDMDGWWPQNLLGIHGVLMTFTDIFYHNFVVILQHCIYRCFALECLPQLRISRSSIGIN